MLEPFAQSRPGTAKGGECAIYVTDTDGKPYAVRAAVLL